MSLSDEPTMKVKQNAFLLEKIASFWAFLFVAGVVIC
jgi:hypothetical protein